jgi:hypothetical protein
MHTDVRDPIDPRKLPLLAATTRVQRNKNMAKLQAGYLFPEVRFDAIQAFGDLDSMPLHPSG